MALISWEPVPMNRLFNSLFDTPTATSPARGIATAPARRFAPATDIVETDTDWILRADVPGVSDEDLSVELDGTVLTISGERRSQAEQRASGYHRYERSSGSFRRSIRLPEGVDGDAIQASFDRGVLEVTVPKPAQPTPHKVAISVGQAQPALDNSATAADGSDAVDSGEPAAA